MRGVLNPANEIVERLRVINFNFERSIQKMVKTFDGVWEDIHRSTEWGKYPSEEVIRFIARNFYNSQRKNVKLLDFGCGSGAITWYLAREGFDTYGFDGSASAVEKCRQLMSENNLHADLKVRDAAETLYLDEMFDGIVDSAVIYANDVAGIKLILKECFRLLKNGGKIFSTGLFTTETSNYDSGEKVEHNTFRNLTRGPLANRGTVHYFDKYEIEDLWTAAGFKNISIDYLKRTDNNGETVVAFYMVKAEK